MQVMVSFISHSSSLVQCSIPVVHSTVCTYPSPKYNALNNWATWRAVMSIIFWIVISMIKWTILSTQKYWHVIFQNPVMHIMQLL